MKIVLSVLVLCGILALIAFGPWSSAEDPPQANMPPEDFLHECMGNSPKSVKNPMDYCLCLWGEGLKKASHAFTKMEGHMAAKRCVSKVGQSGPSTIQQVREELSTPGGNPMKVITEEQPSR